MGELVDRPPLDRALDLRLAPPLVLPRDVRADLALDVRLDLAVERARDMRDDDALFDPARLPAPLAPRLLLRDAAPPFEPRDPEVPDRPRFCVLFFDDVLRVRVAFMGRLFRKIRSTAQRAPSGPIRRRKLHAVTARHAQRARRIIRASRDTPVRRPHAG
jgi:hypothetical protein